MVAAYTGAAVPERLRWPLCNAPKQKYRRKPKLNNRINTYTMKSVTRTHRLHASRQVEGHPVQAVFRPERPQFTSVGMRQH